MADSPADPARPEPEQVNGNDDHPTRTRDPQRLATSRKSLKAGKSDGAVAESSKPLKKEVPPEKAEHCCLTTPLFRWRDLEPNPQKDSDMLYDPAKGVSDPANIKNPVKFFTKKEMSTILPHVEHCSAHLLEIIEELQAKQYEKGMAALRAAKQPLLIPRKFYEVEGGADLYISAGPSKKEAEKNSRKRKLTHDSPVKNTKRIALVSDVKDTSPDFEESMKANDRMLTTVVIGEGAQLSKETIDILMKPFELGWKRELVWRSGASLGRKTGDVFYYPPKGKKLRSSKQLALYLEEFPEPGIDISNFSFSKRPIGIENENYEMIRTANAGSIIKKKPVAPRKISEKKEVKEAKNALSPDIASVGTKTAPTSRRSIQKPKRYANDDFSTSDSKPKSNQRNERNHRKEDDNSMMEMGMLPPMYPRGREDGNPVNTLTENGWTQPERKRGRPPKANKKPEDFSAGLDEGDSALFQISAFRKSQDLGLFSGMNTMNDYNILNHNHDDDDDDNNEDAMMGMYDNGSYYDGEQAGSSNREELLPCSIRCEIPGGEVPSLQCKLCLCLYHPQCLGFPSNVTFNNDFLCANCEGGNRRISKPPPLSLPKMKKEGKFPMFAGISKGKMTKPLPPLIPTANFPKIPMPSLGKFDPNKFPSYKKGKIELPTFMNNEDKGFMSRNLHESMSISPISMKRGRGRPPGLRRTLPPTLSHSNLTITPISIPKNPAVPFLQHMGKLKLNVHGSFPKLGKGITLPEIPVPKGKALNKGQPSDFQQRKAKIEKQYNLTTNQPRIPEMPKMQKRKEVVAKKEVLAKKEVVVKKEMVAKKELVQKKELVAKKEVVAKIKVVTKTQQPAAPAPLAIPNKPSRVYKKYPQSVVSIGQKKFIVVPRNPPKNETAVKDESNMIRPNGEEPKEANNLDITVEPKEDNKPEIPMVPNEEFAVEPAEENSVYSYKQNTVLPNKDMILETNDPNNDYKTDDDDNIELVDLVSDDSPEKKVKINENLNIVKYKELDEDCSPEKKMEMNKEAKIVDNVKMKEDDSTEKEMEMTEDDKIVKCVESKDNQAGENQEKIVEPNEEPTKENSVYPYKQDTVLPNKDKILGMNDPNDDFKTDDDCDIEFVDLASDDSPEKKVKINENLNIVKYKELDEDCSPEKKMEINEGDTTEKKMENEDDMTEKKMEMNKEAEMVDYLKMKEDDSTEKEDGSTEKELETNEDDKIVKYVESKEEDKTEKVLELIEGKPEKGLNQSSEFDCLDFESDELDTSFDDLGIALSPEEEEELLKD